MKFQQGSTCSDVRKNVGITSATHRATRVYDYIGLSLELKRSRPIHIYVELDVQIQFCNICRICFANALRYRV
jgi:hypothetical protein